MNIQKSNTSQRIVRIFGAVMAIWLLCLSPGDAWAQDESGAVLLPHIYVIGSRRPVRSTTDTASPVDIITGEDFTDQGTGDMSNLLRTLVPSYNVGPNPINDAATFIRPANLRGLASDQTLIFVNGKRRHRAAVISFLGNGVSEGAQGADISVIPAIALDRVEVLRDSASAQYGSDAIAGAINFVLKDSPDGGIVEIQWGQTYEGDGNEYRTAFNIGVPVTETGFANFSAEWRESGPTVRSVQRDDAAQLIAAGNTHVRQPYAQIWGKPDVDGDVKLFVNSGIEVGERAEFYAFGNIARRETEGGFFFRNPETREGVNVDGDGNLLEYTLSSGETFRWTQVFPGGFTPQLKGKVDDKAATVGFRGSFDSGLTYDASYTIGRSRIDLSIRDTVNSSLGPFSTGDTQDFILGPEPRTQFELGSYVETDQTANADLTYEFGVPMFFSPLHVATGVEWRRESFQILEGERDSWVAGPLAEAGFGIGANGFSGFSDRVAGEWDRSNIAAYVDFEADVLSSLTLAIMGRWEKFDDFGSTTDGKISAFLRLVSGLSLRGSTSTGFRAPTVAQQNIQNVTTEFLFGGLRQIGTIPPTCPEARQVGAEPLEPEKSLTFALGLVAESDMASLTVDYFNIRVNDRLGKSKDYKINRQVEGSCLEANDVLEFSFYGNGFDTRTQGVDIVATVNASQVVSFLGHGETELILVGNWTDTQVIKHDPTFLDEKRILQLEKVLPDYRFNATLRHDRNKWSGFLRLNYFGSYHETHVDDLELLIHPGDEITLDAELSYVLLDSIELSVGAENLFNNFPDRNPYAGEVGSKYPESSPMGLAGGFYYGRLRYMF